MRITISWILSGLFFVILGCQIKPTKVYQTVPTQVKRNGESSQLPALSITEKTIIVDARPSFEYAVAHLNGAINLRPEDFTQREEAFRGIIDLDKFALTRRLARLGMAPDSSVIVVGRGLEGGGEEGRVAWTLKLLGVKDVRFSNINYFSLPLSSAEAAPRDPAPMWKPELDESLVVEKDDFMRMVRVPKNAFSSPLIVDVRSADQYLGKSLYFSRETPDVGALNVPWTEFFDSKGLVQTSIKEKLNAVGVSPDRIIYVIGNVGVESAAVTLALRELGYNKTANFAGGYQELMLGGASSKSKFKAVKKHK